MTSYFGMASLVIRNVLQCQRSCSVGIRGRVFAMQSARSRLMVFFVGFAAVLASISGYAACLAATSTQKQAGSSRTEIIDMLNTPFPYSGTLPNSETEFLDVHRDGKAGHTSPRGGIYWENPTYISKKVLISFSGNFDATKPLVEIVFFHGNNVILSRDVVKRQKVISQFLASKINGVLIAPQFAVDALDSSAGSFWKKGVFDKFMQEANHRLADFYGDPAIEHTLNRSPMLIMAYSGGYNPASYILSNGDRRGQICGVVLFDALFGERERFENWVLHKDRSFFLSTYSRASAGENQTLQKHLAAAGLQIEHDPEQHLDLRAGYTGFIAALKSTHNDFLTTAWTSMPVRSVMAHVQACGQSAKSPGGDPDRMKSHNALPKQKYIGDVQ